MDSGTCKNQTPDTSSAVSCSLVIPTEEGFSHPITFAEAISQRIEFSIQDDDEANELNQTLKFRQLPDTWVVIRREHRTTANPDSNGIRIWLIDAVSMDVTPLQNAELPTRDTDVIELTALGPDPGDFHWTATYDNVIGRFGFFDPMVGKESGIFDYLVCGWYANKSKDPAYMEEDAAESDWFEMIKNDLRWSVNRMDVDDDPDYSNLITMAKVSLANAGVLR